MKINGKKVVDATHSVELVITPKHIKRGNTKDPGGCAAALACMEEVPGCSSARVHIGRTYIELADKWVRYQTSRALRSEIVAFDRGGNFEPGKYNLSPMSKSERLLRGKAHSRHAPKHGRPGHHRAKHHTVTGIRPHGAVR